MTLTKDNASIDNERRERRKTSDGFGTQTGHLNRSQPETALRESQSRSGREVEGNG